MNAIENGKILVLGEKDTQLLLDMPTVISDVERALKEYAEGLCVNPVKLHLSMQPDYEGYMNSMPAYIRKHNVMGAKLVAVYGNNMKKYGLPVTNGVIVLMHPDSGLPFCVVEGTYITAMRTGAAAGVAARYLAVDSANTALLVGAGVQGTMAARAMLTACPNITELRVADLNSENLKRFTDAIAKEFRNVNIVSYKNYKEAVTGAQICIFATTSSVPLSRSVEFDKGTVVLLVAEPVENRDLKRFDKRIADFPECYCVRYNETLREHLADGEDKLDILMPDTFTAELGDVILGKTAGRDSNDDIIAVGMVGMGIEDLMVALTAFDRAMAKDRGIILDLLN